MARCSTSLTCIACAGNFVPTRGPALTLFTIFMDGAVMGCWAGLFILETAGVQQAVYSSSDRGLRTRRAKERLDDWIRAFN